MDVEEFLEKDSTVETILNSLGEKCKLPQRGFLAGGSIANMLLSLYHENSTDKFEINDIDIFNKKKLEIGYGMNRLSGNDRQGEGENALINEMHLGLDLFGNDYGHTYIERDGSSYKVLTTERDGIINKIECHISNPSNPIPTHVVVPLPDSVDLGLELTEEDNKVILKGFDINCCQAGIDLNTKKLHYTKEFVKFLKSKQVMVTIPYTPFHTTLRLLKKIKLYDGFCYCDLEEELQYLYQALNGNASHEAGKVFGIETHEKYETYKDMMDKYFKVEKCTTKDIPYEYRQKYFPDTFNRAFGELPKMLGEIPEELRKLWKYRFRKVKNDDGEEIFNKISDKYNKMYELKSIWELRYRPKKASHQRKIDKIINYKRPKPKVQYTQEHLQDMRFNENPRPASPTYPYNCLLVNEDYYKCDFTDEHIKEIDDFFMEHRMMTNVLGKAGNLQNQLRQIRLLKSIIKKEGEWVIGVLETLGRGKSLPKGGLSREWIQVLIDEEKKRLSTPLCEPVNLDNFKYKEFVTELTTPLTLQNEGKKMGHCVGGYSNSVENGDSRIFHVEVGGIGSTVQISIKKRHTNYWTVSSDTEPPKNDEKEFNISQHYGRYPQKGNIRPTNKNRGIAFKLVYFLANQELTKEELAKVNDTIHQDDEIRKRVQLNQNERMISTNNKWKDWMRDGHRTMRYRGVRPQGFNVPNGAEAVVREGEEPPQVDALIF